MDKESQEKQSDKQSNEKKNDKESNKQQQNHDKKSKETPFYDELPPVYFEDIVSFDTIMEVTEDFLPPHLKEGYGTHGYSEELPHFYRTYSDYESNLINAQEGAVDEYNAYDSNAQEGAVAELSPISRMINE